MRSPRFEQRLGGVDHGGDDALGVAGAAAPDVIRRPRAKAKNGGTVSMWVESVTASRSPHCAKTLKRRGSTSMRSTRPPIARGQRRQVVEEVIADALFVIGDRFDIDQRAREFEDVHK